MTSARTLLFTDVVGSTALVDRLGDEAAAALWVRHDAAARELLAAHGGREIDRSDGFLLLFDGPAPAAAFAAGYHTALAGLGLSARVGLHHGAVTLRANAADDIARGAKPLEVDGLAKPLAARLMALAAGGRTLASAAACAAFDAAALGLAVQHHGPYRLKGVSEPVEVCELTPAGLPAAEPPADSDKAYAVLRADGDGLWLPRREVRHNLPAERDAFVGRGRELADLAERLQAGERLVTLLGPGGTGKTRLVRRYARAWLGDWPGGVCFCDLSEARSLDGLCYAVAVALDVPIASGDVVTRLGHAIAGRGRCLVILDNVEQLVEHLPATLGAWLDRAPEASFVATSRERLQLPGEAVMGIEPLPTEEDAITLFDARARVQRAGYAADDAQREAVARIVGLLDGLPLAIELAAARVRVLSPVQIVERLRDRFTLLAGARGASARQATLRAAIDWSWELLAPHEQAALAQCAVFEGGFTLDAAEAVIDLARWPDAPPVLDVVQALVDKSLLRAWTPSSQPGRRAVAEPYFGLYLSIQEYVATRLREGGTDAEREAWHRHARHYARLGHDDAMDALRGPDGIRRGLALALELDNLVAACRRSVRQRWNAEAVGCLVAAHEVLMQRGPTRLMLELSTEVRALPLADPRDATAAALAHAVATWRSGRVAEAQACFDEALQLVQAAADPLREAMLWLYHGSYQRTRGDSAAARAAFETAVAQAQRHGLHTLEGEALTMLALQCDDDARIEEADRHHAAAIDRLRRCGHRVGEGIELNNQATAMEERGRYEEAWQLAQASLAIHEAAGNRREAVIVLNNLGNVALALGRLDEARALLERSLAGLRELGLRLGEGIVLHNIGNLLALQGQLHEARDRQQAALAIHRETGNRQVEAGALADLGETHLLLGELDEAERLLAQALAMHHEIGQPRIEGVTRGVWATLMQRRGRWADALAALEQAGALVQAAGDTAALARLACRRGDLEHARGDAAAAAAALARAEDLAAPLGLGEASPLRRAIVALRASLP